MIRSILVFAIAALSFSQISATSSITGSKNFEGTIEFNVDYSGQGISAFKSMLPSKYVYNFLDGDAMFQMEGGMMSSMMGNVIFKGKEGVGYMVMDSEKKVYKIEKPEEDNAGKADVKLENLNEQEEVAGHMCDKYRMTSSQDGKTTVMLLWITKDFSVKKAGKMVSIGSSSSMFDSGVEGFPLKAKVTADAMGMTITIDLTAEKVDETKPSPELFVIPEDYEVEVFDPKKFGMK